MDRHALTGVLRSATQQVGAEFVEVAAPISPHMHDFIEIALIISGSGHHRSRTGTEAAVAGSVFLIRPGSWHAFDPLPSLTVANVYFDERVVFDKLPWLFSDPAKSRRLLSAGTSQWSPPLEAFHEAVHWVTELERHRDAPAMVKVGLLTCIMALMTDFGDPERADERSTPTRELIRGLVARLTAEPHLEWTVDALARSASMSRSHFSRVFRDEVGTSPARFVTQARLERAARLLVSTDLSVARVAERVGLLDANYFSRVFRQTYGSSPIDYRSGFRTQ